MASSGPLSGTVTAAVVAAPGAVPVSRAVRPPERIAGTTLLRVLAAPLNPLDLLIASGDFHSACYQAPTSPAVNAPGASSPPTATRRAPWSTPNATPPPSAPGALSTQVVVPDDDAFPLPDGVNPALAAAIGNSGTAAYLPLMDIARLRAGGDRPRARRHRGSRPTRGADRPPDRAARIIAVGRDKAALDELLDLDADSIVALHPGEAEVSLRDRLAPRPARSTWFSTACAASPCRRRCRPAHRAPGSSTSATWPARQRRRRPRRPHRQVTYQ